MRRENRRHERQLLFGSERFRGRFKLLGGQLLDELHVDPALVHIFTEQVALDPAARADIGLAADEPCLGVGRLDRRQGTVRSEEHTSELQSLMRISYAVFCLKKKNKKTRTQYNRTKDKKYNKRK